MAASWLVKMRVCHITAVVPDDLFHAPTWKSFPMALQLSISRPNSPFFLMTVLFLKIEDVSVLPGALIRMFSNGMRARRASELLIKDLHFGEVPVRIYLPRSPSASKRRGVVLFHGGCGMYGSISKEVVCRLHMLNQ